MLLAVDDNRLSLVYIGGVGLKLSIENISKNYGDVQALKDVSVELTTGIYGLLGPNGAGKSTLINILTDNIKRDKGNILWEDREILELKKDYRRLLGYMPQQQGMYDDYKVTHFLEYMAAIKDVRKKQAEEQITGYLKKLNLWDARNKKIKQLSGGMKQRVLLIQALLGDPKLLILDEPTAGLDPSERINLRNIISDYSKDKIVIFATHVVSDIDYIAKEVILLSKGEIVRKGTVGNLIEEVRGKVSELLCDESELDRIKAEYVVGSISRTEQGILVRVVGDEAPEGAETIKDRPGLEDVYLYHVKKQ